MVRTKILLATDGSAEAGRAAQMAVELSERLGVGLIVVGSRGLGAVGRVRLGSVSTNVLRAARGPVLVYPERRN